MHGFLLDEAGLEMGRYIQDIYGLKKQRPGHDIFSALIAAEEDGERLSRDEIVSNIRILYIAGHETTTT